jgi:hypothetical protein
VDDDLIEDGGIAGHRPAGYPPGGAGDAVQSLFKNALVIAGPLHILHNGMKNVSQYLSSYAMFEGHLETMADFVIKRR